LQFSNFSGFSMPTHAATAAGLPLLPPGRYNEHPYLNRIKVGIMYKYLLPLILLLAACQSVQPYHMEIQQGNFITPQQIAQLKPGMTKAQVASVLGTPLLTDQFHADRWDYVYSDKKQGKPLARSHLTLYFQGDVLQRFEGQIAPAARTAAAAPAAH
jgi:outer membrane protein assembly factor BamE